MIKRRDQDNDELSEEDEPTPSRVVRMARVTWDMKAMKDQLDKIERTTDKINEQNNQQFRDMNRIIVDQGKLYATKEELNQKILEIDERNKPTLEALSRINWIIIAAVVTALLALVLVNRGGLP